MKRIFELSRLSTILAVIALLVAGMIGMVWGVVLLIKAISLLFTTMGTDSSIGFSLIKMVDAFLIAIILIILALGIFELFIGDINIPEELKIRSFQQLKSKLGSAIILVVAVRLLEILLENHNALDILYTNLGGAALIAVLIAFIYFGEKH